MKKPVIAKPTETTTIRPLAPGAQRIGLRTTGTGKPGEIATDCSGSNASRKYPQTIARATICQPFSAAAQMSTGTRYRKPIDTNGSVQSAHATNPITPA